MYLHAGEVIIERTRVNHLRSLLQSRRLDKRQSLSRCATQRIRIFSPFHRHTKPVALAPVHYSLHSALPSISAQLEDILKPKAGSSDRPAVTDPSLHPNPHPPRFSPKGRCLSALVTP